MFGRIFSSTIAMHVCDTRLSWNTKCGVYTCTSLVIMLKKSAHHINDLYFMYIFHWIKSTTLQNGHEFIALTLSHGHTHARTLQPIANIACKLLVLITPAWRCCTLYSSLALVQWRVHTWKNSKPKLVKITICKWQQHQ